MYLIMWYLASGYRTIATGMKPEVNYQVVVFARLKASKGSYRKPCGRREAGREVL
jgi:hypothetical protein